MDLGQTGILVRNMMDRLYVQEMVCPQMWIVVHVMIGDLSYGRMDLIRNSLNMDLTQQRPDTITVAIYLVTMKIHIVYAIMGIG